MTYDPVMASLDRYERAEELEDRLYEQAMDDEDLLADWLEVSGLSVETHERDYLDFARKHYEWEAAADYADSRSW